MPNFSDFIRWELDFKASILLKYLLNRTFCGFSLDVISIENESQRITEEKESGKNEIRGKRVEQNGKIFQKWPKNSKVLLDTKSYFLFLGVCHRGVLLLTLIK